MHIGAEFCLKSCLSIIRVWFHDFFIFYFYLEIFQKKSWNYMGIKFLNAPSLTIMPKNRVYVSRYLNDLDRGLIDGDLRPSSSIKLGLESLEEKWRWWWNIRGSSLAKPPGPGPTGVPAGAGVAAWWPAAPPPDAAAAPNWCNRSWEEHWDWNCSSNLWSWMA